MQIQNNYVHNMSNIINMSKIIQTNYTDKESVIIYVESEDVYEDLAGDVEQRFDTSNYEVKRPPLIEKANNYSG